MCARYEFKKDRRLRTLPQEVAEQLRLLGDQPNIYPGQDVPIIVGLDRSMTIYRAQWGYKPPWGIAWDGPKPINARAEGIAGGMFRGAKRCLVPMTGFWEPGKPGRTSWRSGQARRYFHLQDAHDELLLAAGLWSGKAASTTTIITVAAGEDIANIGHDRQPALLELDDGVTWLTKDYTITEVRSLLEPSHPESLDAQEVSRMGVAPH